MDPMKICLPWGLGAVQYKNSNWTWGDCQLIEELCEVWGTSEFPWYLADWMWSECSGSALQPCAVWSKTAIFDKNANWKWSECSPPPPPLPCAIWSKTAVFDKNANWKWSECTGSVIPPVPVVSVGNQPGVDANTLIPPWIEEPWNPYRAADREQAEKKRRRLIKLICRVKGQEYDEEKTHRDFKVSVGDIKLVVKAVKNIDLEVKE